MEMKDRISHNDQSFVTGSCWRIFMLCDSCDWLYIRSSSTVRAETMVLLKVCDSIEVLL